MAESSIFWTTGGAGDGTNPYTMAQAIKWLERTLGSGIHIGYTNECEPTEAAPNVAVDSGAATLHGFPYENTASLNVNIPNAAAGNERIDRIVLRANWAAQTVRITQITGAEAPAPVAPAITQNDGVDWDEMICQARVTDAGAITVTDERTYSDINTQIQQSRLIDSILTADAAGRLKMAAGFFGADATSRTKFAANLWGADAASRAKFEADFFDEATLLDLVAADSVTNAVLIDAILNGAFQADAASRALFANLFVNAAMLDNDSVSSAKIIDGAIVNVDINAAAAIEQSKLVDIVNADINAAAAIEQTKISNAAPAIDADQLDGEHGAYYAEASDIVEIQRSDSVFSGVLDTIATGYTDLVAMTLTITLAKTSDVIIYLTMQGLTSGAGGTQVDWYLRLLHGALTINPTLATTSIPEMGDQIYTAHWFVSAVAAGAHTFKITWSSAATTNVQSSARTMTAIVIPN